MRIATDVHGWDGGETGGFTAVENVYETLWTYDSQDEISAIDVNEIAADTMQRYSIASWQFDTEHVTVQSTLPPYQRTYDRTLFAFLPMAGSELWFPDAELGLIQADSETYSWQVVSPTLWIRSGPSGGTTTFELDESGRLLEYYVTTDPTIGESYVLSGDELVNHTDSMGTVSNYTYDAKSNLIEKTRATTYMELYSYSCW